MFSRRGNASQNDTETPSHHQNGRCQEHQQQTPVRCGERDPRTLLVGCKSVQPLWKSAWRLLKEVRLELAPDPATPLLGMCV
jgi:hypothetical protein